MTTRKRNPAGSPKPHGTRKRTTAKGGGSLRKLEVDAPAPEMGRGGRDASPLFRETGDAPDASPPETIAKPVKFFVGREGVAFGPYTELQLRESVRLGIFESHDLALAEDGKEWLEVSQVLPTHGASREQPPDLALATPPEVEEGRAWTEVSRVLPRLATPREQPQPGKARFKPLTEQQLREHEMLSCHSRVPTLIGEFSRGRLAFAAIPVAVIFLALLTLAAGFKHHESSVVAGASPRSSAALAVGPAPGETRPPRARPSTRSGGLPPLDVARAATPEKLTASTQTPDAVVYQDARARRAP